jgi:hypothetical protein
MKSMDKMVISPTTCKENEEDKHELMEIDFLLSKCINTNPSSNKFQ